MKPQGPLLAIETATATARVAIVTVTGQLLAHEECVAGRHGGVLLALCARLMAATDVHTSTLAGIACGQGPGSFTGLRVGLALAKGLATPFQTPLVLVSSLEALAFDLATLAPLTRWHTACLDAGKGEIHGQLFCDSLAVAPPMRADPAAVIRWATELAQDAVTFGGNGVDRFSSIFVNAVPRESLIEFAPGPSTYAIAHIAIPKLQSGQHADLDSSVPSYGRSPDITRPRPPSG